MCHYRCHYIADLEPSSNLDWRRYARRALEAADTTLGSHHPDTIVMARNLSSLLRAIKGHTDESVPPIMASVPGLCDGFCRGFCDGLCIVLDPFMTVHNESLPVVPWVFLWCLGPSCDALGLLVVPWAFLWCLWPSCGPIAHAYRVSACMFIHVSMRTSQDDRDGSASCRGCSGP